MIGAVSAASDSNDASQGSNLADGTITQNGTDACAVDDNPNTDTEKAISKDSNLKSESDVLKMGMDTPNNELKDSGSTTVNNWGELKSAVNDGAVIELEGDDVYYAEGSGISIDFGTVTIDGKGHTIDAQRLNSHIFEINDGATLILENIILKNTFSDDDGGAVYIDQGTLTVIGCTFTNNTATTENGGAIYNYEGTLKIVNSKFEKNSKYDRAIYNYCEDEDNPFRLTIINATMVEDKVCVNYNDKERRLDDKRDIDFLTTEFNVNIQEILYNGTPVFIDVSEIDNDFSGSITTNITNTIHNTEIKVANGKGNTTMNLDINRYTARFKNFISVDDIAFDRNDTKPYLEINFRIICEGTLSDLEYLIRESTDNVTLNQDYTFNTICDAPNGIKISGKKLTINGNGHTVKADKMDDGAIFYIEDDYYKDLGSDVTIANMTLEGAHAVSASHLTIQTRMGGAIYVFKSNLTVINCTFKDNEAKDGFGGAIYGYYSNLNIIDSNFINNTAANGNILCIWRGNANILSSNVNQEDIHSEPNLDDDDRLGAIAIFNALNATLYIPNQILGNDTLFNITQPKNLNAFGSLTINNNPKGDIQITNGHASANLNLDLGSYTATITTPDFVYYTDAARNLTCTYFSASTTSNEFKVLRTANVELTVQNITYGENETITANIDAEGNVTIRLDGKPVKDYLEIDNGKIEYTITEYLTGGNHTVEVIYNGDTYVLNCSKSANFTVRKANTTMSLELKPIIAFGETQTINITLGDADATGKVTINMDSEDHIVNITKGLANFKTDVLSSGTYEITVSYSGDNNFNGKQEVATLTITKVNSTLTVNDIEFDYGSEGSTAVSFTGADNVSADVIDQQNAIVEVNNHVITVSGLNAGNYTLTVTTIPDNNHAQVTKTANIVVNKVYSTLEIDDMIINYNSTGFTTVSFTGATKINAEIINQPNATVEVDDTTITVSGLNAGNYTLSATTIPDENHIAITETATITVLKINSTITLNNLELDYCNTTTANIITNGATGITATIDGNEIASSGNSILIPILNAGIHTLTVTTIPDDNHNKVTKTVNIIVNKIDSTLNVNDIAFNYNSTGFTTVSFTGATKISAEIVNQPNATVEVDDTTITVYGLNAGNYTLKVTTTPDENHKPITKTTNIVVNKINSKLTIDNIIIDYGKTTTANATTEGANGITATIDGNKITPNGNSIPIQILNAGTHKLTVTTIPDDNHNPLTKTVNIVVNKVDSTLNVNDIVFNYNSTGSTSVSFTCANNVSAEIVDQPNAAIEVDNTTITVYGLNAGNYTLKVTTTPDENHKPITKTVNVIVNKINSKLTIDNIIIDYGKSATVNATTEGATSITAKINNENIKVNGFTIPITGLDAGNYTLTVTTNSDKNHNPVTRTASIKVSKVATEVRIDVKQDYKVGESFDIYITNNTAATVTINNNTYNIENGKIDIDTSTLPAGTYEVIAAIAENTNYLASLDTATFTISKLSAPKVVIDVENSVVEGSDLVVNVHVDDATGIVGINGAQIILANGTASTTIKNVQAGELTIYATYSGDSRYLNSSNSTKVNVYAKNDANLKASAEDIEVGEAVTINVEINPNVTGKVIIDNDEVFISNGKGIHTISNLDAGTYSIVVKFTGDKYFKAGNATASFNVTEVETPGNDTNASTGNATGNNTGGNATDNNNTETNTTIIKADPNLRVNVADVNVGEIAVVTVSMNSTVNGNVIVTFNDADENASISNGKGTYNIRDLAAGEYFVVVKYAGDEYFTADEVTAHFKVIEIPINETNTTEGNNTETNTTIIKTNPKLTVTASDVNVGETVTVDISINEKATGNIIVELNGHTAVVSIANGKCYFNISSLDVGNYTVLVRFTGDEYFTADEVTAHFKVIEIPINETNTTEGNNTETNTTIIKTNPELTVDILDITVGETVTVDISINEKATGNIIVELNGYDTIVSIANGKGSQTFPNLPVGNYTALIKYAGDEYFNADEITAHFKVIEIPINDTNTTTENTTNNNNTNTTFNKTNPELTVNILNITVGETVTVDISINEKSTGNVIVTFNGEDNFISISKGKGIYNIPNLTAGNYNITVKYTGDNYFNADEKTVSFKVIANTTSGNTTNNTSGNTTTGNTTNNTGENTTNNTNTTIVKVNPELTVTASDVNVGETVTLKISIKENATGNLIIEFNGESNTINLTNGTRAYTIPDLTAGNYSITVKYTGDNYFNTDEKTVSFKVIKTETPSNETGNDTNNTIDLERIINSSENTSDNGTIAIELPSDATGTVTLTVEGQNYTFDLVDGKANITLPNLDNGNYNYTITYSGDSKYSKVSSSYTLSVSKEELEIDTSVIEKPVSEETVIVDLPSDATGTVTLTVEGQNYTFPVENGKANVKIPALANGGHNYTISYSGDAKYSRFTKEGSLTVSKTSEKTTPVTPIHKEDTIKLTLKTVKVKKSAKKLVLQATLKINGKAVKNKKITFKFKGKKYTAKTNKKGVAKVTIKKNVLKKLKVGKKVKYQANYGKITVEKTVKTKK